jgi:hypothetical protein
MMQAICRGGTVVWVDPQSGIYYLKGVRHMAMQVPAATPAAAKRKGLACGRSLTDLVAALD